MELRSIHRLFACAVAVAVCCGGAVASGQVLSDGAPNPDYTPLHAWYDVNQSLGIWEDQNTPESGHNDEILVDVRDTATSTGGERLTSYGTNVETWAQWGGDWQDRQGGFTGAQNEMTVWEVRNAAGWDDDNDWTDDDGVGTVGIGNAGNGYTFFLMLNVHSAQHYRGVWNGTPDGPLDDAPIFNGSQDMFNADPTTGSEPGKGLLWIDAARDGYDGAQWVMDDGNETVAGDVTLGEWQVHAFTFNDEGKKSHYVDGELVAEESGTGGVVMGGVQWWASNGGWHRAADIDFAEGIFYDEVVSGDDRAGIEAYLMDKWLSPGGLPGDVNLDGEINGLDVDPFVDVLLNGPFQAEADMNEDGEVNGLDVDMFVEAVVGGGVQAVPEPSSLALAVVALMAALGCGWRQRRNG